MWWARESPPFRELSDDEVAESVRTDRRTSRADVVWVGMGTPKQDLLVHQMSAMSDKTFVAIGAAFDFIAGTKSQAPRWIMRIGMEWLYRLVTEPRRLAKRYLVYNAKFLRLLWRDRGEHRVKALIVHNHYASAQPSGENRVVIDDVDVLRAAGVTVGTHFRDSDSIAEMSMTEKVLLPLRPTYSRREAMDFRSALTEFDPDVVHLHNVYPLISPTVIRIASRYGSKVIQTVHNYRHSSASGIHFRDGEPCTECIGKRVPIPAVRHSCYRGSRSASASMALSLAAHRSTWKLVDLFLAVGPDVVNNLRLAGIESDRIRLRPNRVTAARPVEGTRTLVTYIGRLAPEKGIQLLLDAWSRVGRNTGRTLAIAGAGPLQEEVERFCNDEPTATFHGLLPQAQVEGLFDRSALVVVPSLWPEPDPLTAITALAHGCPILATRRGALSHYLDDDSGWLVDTTTASLSEGLAVACRDTAELERRGRGALALARLRAKGYVPLDTIYRDMLGGSSRESGSDGSRR